VIEKLLRQDRELKRARINSETARIPWLELQRFFAAGKVMQVSTSLDLVDVAYAMQQDDVEQVQQWTEEQKLGPVADDQAREWISNESSLWAVVVKPWVLVQEPD
jgi:hypothetical protein